MSKKNRATDRAPSRMSNRGTRSARAPIASTTPSGSSTSSVRGWMTAAREVLAPSVAASTTRTSTPARRSPIAAVRPVGPAPTTSAVRGAVDVIMR